ncbi:TetR family transcriptional regulator [Streptomyces microflavus]|uniref:TetR/AcrR family transcriptional regulator n=1 Tax=Streptomyces microflavus TaxID=1919 RepID=UPI0029B06593|nr:TetR family transcriptional regulator [Streptomyces microflavus]
MDTFAARGYNNASLAEIADRVGLTQAGVLHYFRSKALLLTSVLELRDRADIEQLGPDRPQGLDFLRHLVNTALRNAEREGIVRLYAVLSAESVTDDHPAQEYFRDRYDGLRVFVADALREACELPADRADITENAANAIIAVMDGLQVQWLLAPDSVDMAASTDLVVTSLLATLAPGRFGPSARR